MDAAVMANPTNNLTGLAADLKNRHDSGSPIRVAIVGAGQMGTDLVVAIARMKGLEVAAIADRRLSGAPQAIEMAGYDADHGSICENPSAINAAIDAGRIAISQNSSDVISNPQINVVIDATGRPIAAAEVGMAAMEAGKHLVMMNVEADVTVGSYMQNRARELGVVYTVGAGDEPSSTLELYNFVTALGYPVVAAGKGKNNAFQIDATPDDFRAEAEARNMNPRMLVEFVDGSKTMVEMSCIANATGLVPDVPGMHGPDCTMETLHNTLCPREDGGILSQRGCVDFSVGEGVAPGVFVVVEMDHPRIRERMNDLKLGPGPYYAFYRPYHLTSLEVPLSAARAALYGTADMHPMDRPVAEVCALSKRDLKAGEELDFIGEYCYRSWAMKADEARLQQAIPVGLLHGSRMKRDLKAGELITAENCEVNTNSMLYQLRLKQDQWLGYV